MPTVPNQGPNSPNIAGHGGGVDPCSSYQPTICGSVSSTEKDYAPYFTDPSSLRDSNGCYMFNGCYLKFGGHYYYWTGQAGGYNIVSPQFGGGGGTGGTGGVTSSALTDCGPDGKHKFIGAPITVNGVEYTWWSADFGYIPVGQTPNTFSAIPCGTGGGGTGGGGTGGGGTGGGGGAFDLTAFLAAFGWIQPFLISFNQILSGLPATLTQGLLAGNGPLLEAINKLIKQGGGSGGIDPAQWTNIITALSNQLAQNSLDFTKAAADETQQTIVTLTDQVSELTNAAIDKINNLQSGNDLTQQDYNLAGTTLFQQISMALSGANEAGLLDWGKLLTGGLGNALPELGKFLGDRLQAYKLLFDYLLAGKFANWSELEQALHAISGTNDLGFLLIDLIGIVTIVLRLGIIRANPIADELNQLSNADHPVRPLDQNTLLEAYRRQEIDLIQLAAETGKLGIDGNKTLLMAALTEQLPGAGVLEQAVLRGFTDPIEAKKILAKQGFSQDTINIMALLWDHIPAPADLTRIADKRVWGDQIDKRFGQFSEIPEEYRKYMAQWGFDPQFTEWLWASHWNLPSPQQIFEMKHRNKLKPGDFEAYLALTDWLPYFRDLLYEISFTPLGRIDIKRAHNAGFIGDTEAKRKYQEIGYDEENAAILLKISQQSGHDNAEHLLQQITDRTRTAVENAYKKGSITAQEATAHLVSLGIDAATAAALLAVLDHEIVAQGTLGHREAHQKRAIDAVIRAFSKGSLPYDDAIAYLGDLSVDRYSAIHELMFAEIEREAELKGEWANHAVKLFTEHTIEWPDFVAMLRDKGFSDTEINQLGQEADMKRQQRAKKPTEAQFKSAYKKQIISEAEFANELRGLGYNEKYVAMLIKEA